MRNKLKLTSFLLLLYFQTSCTEKQNIKLAFDLNGLDNELQDFFKNFVIYGIENSVELCENCESYEFVIRFKVDKNICEDCYAFSQTQNGVVALFSSKRGLIYSVSHILESVGFRFFHPFYTFIPEKIDHKKISPLVGKSFQPEINLRGLHLHTLHPIESLFSFWIPGEKSLDEAIKIMIWVLRNRGNYIQYVALADIYRADTYVLWKNHTTNILDYARRLGLKIGINPLIFAESSLQNAFILTKDRANLIINNELKWDIINLSFGEFIGGDPERFISYVNEIYESITSTCKECGVSATIHVGNFENLIVDYKGEKILYYFLVKYTNPKIIPWVHTVMYYNLFDSAGGAYGHRDFSMHREFLCKYIIEGKEVGYFPETAYWIAFDNSVPLFLPVYIYSRWKDLFFIKKECGKIPQHIVFSSGWEWGYWLNDYIALRFSYSTPATYKIYDVFEPLENGNTISKIIFELADIQKRYLIDLELTPYNSSEDELVNFACKYLPVYSQPCRIQLEEILKMDDSKKKDFERNIIGKLIDMKNELEKLKNEVKKVNEKNEIVDEIKDGIEIDFLRTKFVVETYSAVLNFSYGKKEEAERFLSEAEKTFELAQDVVKRRREKLFYPRKSLILESVENPTIYKFGYLKQADRLCFWEREILTAKRIIKGSSISIPTCMN